MSRTGVRVQQRSDRIPAGRGELGGPPDEMELPIVVVAPE